MIRTALIMLLLSASLGHAQTVSGQKVSTITEVIFYVTEGTNSPYQGRLAMTPAQFQALSGAQLRALQFAQYQAWKAVRDAPQPPITKADLIEIIKQRRAERDRLQAEADQLQAEVDATP